MAQQRTRESVETSPVYQAIQAEFCVQVRDLGWFAIFGKESLGLPQLVFSSDMRKYKT